MDLQKLTFGALPFLICFYLGRRSLTLGMMAVLASGYFYGIVRANWLGSSYFLFDLSVAGFYLGAWTRSYDVVQRLRVAGIWQWLLALSVWPLLLFCLPLQDLMVQLVGLRAAILFLPMVLIGALLTDDEMHILTTWLAVLNLAAFGFAVAEYFWGVPTFYPYNPVTQIIYRETDVAGYTAFRIPATFANAAGYGSTMVMSMPLLVGAWLQSKRPRWRYLLFAAAIAATILGVFMSASRSQAAIMFLLGAVLLLSGALPIARWFAWLVIIVGVAWLVGSSNRLQRFTKLEDANMVDQRISVGMNANFLYLAEQYPLGNGLGGGGTSMPYFLQERVRSVGIMENEYARIMLEEGVPGLLLWVGFIVWVLSRKRPRPADPWFISRRLAWCMCAACFASAVIGIGLLAAVPNATMLLMHAGWVAAPPYPVPSPVSAAVDDGQQAAWSIARRRYGW